MLPECFRTALGQSHHSRLIVKLKSQSSSIGAWCTRGGSAELAWKVDSLRVRIEQNLLIIETVAASWCICSGDATGIETGIGQLLSFDFAMPNASGLIYEVIQRNFEEGVRQIAAFEVQERYGGCVS